MQPEEFAQACAQLLDLGAVYIGGCCGTTPAFIAALHEQLAGKRAWWKERTVQVPCMRDAISRMFTSPRACAWA